jgi:hypothetical protein
MVVRRDLRPPYIPDDIWAQYIQHVMSKRFTRHSQSGAKNRNRQINGSVTTHTSGFVLFIAHVKWIVRLILMTSIFINLLLFINIFNLQHYFSYRLHVLDVS